MQVVTAVAEIEDADADFTRLEMSEHQLPVTSNQLPVVINSQPPVGTPVDYCDWALVTGYWLLPLSTFH